MHTIGDYIDHQLDIMTEPFSALSDGFTMYLYYDSSRERCIGMVEFEAGQLRFRSEHIENLVIKIEPKAIGANIKTARDWFLKLVDWRVAN